MATILSTPSARPAFDDDVAERGNALYTEQLKGKLEQGHVGQYVAIHVESGDYEVAGWSGDATRALRKRHANGLLFVRVIGPPTERERRMASRLMAAEQEARG